MKKFLMFAMLPVAIVIDGLKGLGALATTLVTAPNSAFDQPGQGGGYRRPPFQSQGGGYQRPPFQPRPSFGGSGSGGGFQQRPTFGGGQRFF
jgi:hypothetical protein